MSPKKVISISILILTILSLTSVLVGVFNPILILNENQILYLYSTSAQVLAGVYGLTLTGFIFFRNELSREEFDDDSLTEAVESLKERYFKLLLFVTLLSIFSLFICNFIISIEGQKNSIFKTILINVAQSSFIVSLLTIAYFIFDVIAPKRIEKASLKLQQTFDPIGRNVEQGSLEEFLRNFNQIEYILQKYGQAFQSNSYNYSPKSQRRISNIKLAQIILQAEKIDSKLYDEIKRLITLRNSIVHGAEPIVSSNMVSTSREILISLSEALGVHIPE
ncbi:hypothetical protein [Pantoea ananatis]|uniref:hypothetical protein n=1 Tax=Pantoea ananas TaxID=553 RepID=UPI000CF5662F|nr:hypothetical protein [Pantoea ananatis]PQK76353.1 hypothetical protein CG427_06250 [Pantoea ananatis]PQK93313.1 hypothetical protein CG433_11410 [Pantoea ananatis]